MNSKSNSFFIRIEKKYRIDRQQYKELTAYLKERFRPDGHGECTICNLYFDTPDHVLIRRSIEKPPYKEKLRIRSYGIPEEHSRVFVEMKKKYKKIVYKRRVDMKYNEAVEYVENIRPAENPSQITREIDWFKGFYGDIRPAMYIAYDREAMFATEDPELRITFDRNIRWREQELNLTTEVWGNKLLKDDQYIMEIKAPAAMPIWLVRALSDMKIYPAPYSKYGNAYETVMRERLQS